MYENLRRWSKYQQRLCDKPKPQNGGKSCALLGAPTKSQTCNTDACPGNELLDLYSSDDNAVKHSLKIQIIVLLVILKLCKID